MAIEGSVGLPDGHQWIIGCSLMDIGVGGGQWDVVEKMAQEIIES